MPLEIRGDNTTMEVDRQGQDQQTGHPAEASAQEQPCGLPSLRSMWPRDFVEAIAQISLLGQAMSELPPRRESL